MATRQYADVAQDDLVQPYFTFGPGFIDWQAHIGSVTDYWCHVLLYASSYQIDAVEIFRDTVDSGWTGPCATSAKKRATGTAWAMAHRFLGNGVWRSKERRA